MEMRYQRSCRVDIETAEKYIYYCHENDIEFDAYPEGASVYIVFTATEKRIKQLYRWILKTAFLGGSQRGKRIN